MYKRQIQNNPLGINWKVAPIDLPAHNLKEEIIQSPEKMGSIYYAYPTPNGIQTPVPEGYSPFYISHYGRHGSRWMTSDERYLEVIRVFDTFHNKSGLTDLGEDVRLRLQKVWENARGRGGNLTPLGERQHKAIAKRLYQQYPHIFRDSANISARSSVSVRCIMSMSAFTEQLKELNPSLQILSLIHIYQDSIEIVVHRGANHIAPENTIPSALAALKHGAGWIEVDVRKSKDNILYNLHDETLDRTTNGKGPIQDMLSKDCLLYTSRCV